MSKRIEMPLRIGCTHLALIGAMADVMLSGDDSEVRRAVVIRVPEGCIGADRARMSCIGSRTAAVGHPEALRNRHTALPARIIT